MKHIGATIFEHSPFPATVEFKYKIYNEPRSIKTRELMHAQANGEARAYGYRDACAKIVEVNQAYFPKATFTAHGFDLDEAVDRVSGPIIELGGPTLDHKIAPPLIGAVAIGQKHSKRVLVSNIQGIECGVLDPDDQLDVLIDAGDLPFDDESVGLIFARCLPGEAREYMFDEAMRTLKPDGILMYGQGTDLDIYHALSLGFDIKAYSRYSADPSHLGFYWNTIFHKPSIKD